MKERLDVAEIVRRCRETKQVERWPVPRDLEMALEVTLRNRFAENLAERPAEEVCLRYAACSSEGMKKTLQLAERHVLPGPLQGIGIELGAGCGLLSSVVALSPRTQTILAVEVCSPQVELLIPKVARHVLGPQADKVIPVVGSFDDLRVPDGSMDFAIEYHSYHHSGDLGLTMRELARALRPGGIALLFDRVHPNSVTDAEVEALLSSVYPREFLVNYNYPLDLKLARRDHGEHEYRLREWEAAFTQAGLHIERQVEFYPRISFKGGIKGLASLLPSSVRDLLYQTENATPQTTYRYLAQQLRQLTPAGRRSRILGAHRDTVLLIRKPN